MIRYHPRLTVRRLMVAVAIAALALGGEMCRRRRVTLLARANLHRLKELYFRNRRTFDLVGVSHIEMEINKGVRLRPRRGRGRRADPKQELEEARKALESSTAAALYHARMREKYDRAARYPWLPVEPDPPGPE